ncbi:MAG: bifunctional diguanylate cyclase/phosphodiesterase [Alphaproteobacteria bacterium]
MASIARSTTSESSGAQDLASPRNVADLVSRLEESFRSVTSLADKLEVAREEVNRTALLDPLTECPNRTLFYDRLQQTLLGAKRSNSSFPLMVVDLDRFKEINETLGYAFGDDVLREVARRLRGLLRESDTVARLGSDDFGVLLSSTASVEAAANVAERVIDTVSAKASIRGQSLDLPISIGIAIYPTHGEDAEALLRHADMALTEARRARVPYSVFATSGADASAGTLRLATEIRSAIERDELVLHYQPKVSMATGRTIGVEALVRWQHPELGLIMPGDFMPLIERTALITPMSLKILTQALKQSRAWSEIGLDVPVAVNLSPRSLHQTDLPDRVAEILETVGVQPGRLSVEITETAIMVDEASAETVVRRLADLGVHIAIDDFGTGYSSLTRLRRLPVSELKIDRSFVRNMAQNNEDSVIVRALVDLGHRLGQRIVAEGVEDEATWQNLKSWGCDAAQGYHLCRPAPPQKLTTWLEQSPFGCSWDRLATAS